MHITPLGRVSATAGRPMTLLPPLFPLDFSFPSRAGRAVPGLPEWLHR